MPLGWTRLLARSGFFFFRAVGMSEAYVLCGESSEEATLNPWLPWAILLGTELFKGEEGRTWPPLGPVWGESDPTLVGVGQCWFPGGSALCPSLFLARQFRIASSRRSMRYTSSVASFTRSNRTSKISRSERRCWMSPSASELSRALRVRLSPSSWLEEVEALSEMALGVGPRRDRESWLDEREGSGSIPSKRTLWRNCREKERDF